MEKLGIYNIDEMDYGDKSLSPIDVTEDFVKIYGERYDHRALEMAGNDISEIHFRYIRTDSRRMCWMNSERSMTGSAVNKPYSGTEAL